VVSGWALSSLAQWQLGYVNLPAFLGLALFSVLTAPFGARLAHRLPPLVLKRAFALLLATVGVLMLTRSA